MIDLEILKTLVQYDPEEGVLVWIKKTSPKSRVCLGSKVGSIGTEGYLQTKIYQRQYKVHRLIWFLVHGLWPPYFIDHIDGDTSNNRLSNLRLADESQNQQNRKKNNTYAGKVTSSKYKGVCWNKDCQKWMAMIKHKGKSITIGYFESELVAGEAYNKKAKKYFSDYANVNEI